MEQNDLVCPVDLATLESLASKNCPYILAYYGAVVNRVTYIFYANKSYLLFCFSVELSRIVSFYGINGCIHGEFFQSSTFS